MPSYNKVILVGNLTRDPQLSYLPSQTPVVEFGLAVNHRWRGANGEQREETCFIDCRCYGKQAETLNQYVTKGQALLVEGRLQFDTWEGQDGQKRSKHRVFVQGFQFLSPSRGQGQGQGQGGGQARQAPPPPPAQAPQAQQSPPAPPADDFPPPPEAPGGEEIPF